MNKYNGGPYKVMCRPGSYLLIKDVIGLDANLNSVFLAEKCPDLKNTVMAECSGRQQCILYLSKLRISTSVCSNMIYLKIVTGCIDIKEMAGRGFAPRPNIYKTNLFKRFTRKQIFYTNRGIKKRQFKANYLKFYQLPLQNKKMYSKHRHRKIIKQKQAYLNQLIYKKIKWHVIQKLIRDIKNEIRSRKLIKINNYLLYIAKLKKRNDENYFNTNAYMKNYHKKVINKKVDNLNNLQRRSLNSTSLNIELRTLSCTNKNCSITLTKLDNLQNIILIAKTKLLENFKVILPNSTSINVGQPQCVQLSNFTHIKYHKSWNMCRILDTNNTQVELMIKKHQFLLIVDSKKFLIQLNSDISQLFKHLNEKKNMPLVNKIIDCTGANCTNHLTLVTEKHMKETCGSDYCSNKGFCFLSTIGSKICICQLGYGGLKCEHANDSCASRPCLHASTCYNLGDSKFKCYCSPGYSGIYCHNAIKVCQNISCLNGGVCRPSKQVSGFTCLCPPGYGGLQCELNDPCLSHPCKNGALCKLSTNTSAFLCQCPEGFSGVYCDTLKTHISKFNALNDACSRVPCKNNAVCQPTSILPGYICICANGVKGKMCEIDNKNECLSHPCHNNGVCVDLAGEFKCMCSFGFSGVTCEQKSFQDICDSGPCTNDGKCQMINKHSYKCFCRALYTGKNCNIKRNPCNSSTICSSGKKCIEMPVSFINSFICVDTTNSQSQDYRWSFVDSNAVYKKPFMKSLVRVRHVEPYNVLVLSVLVLISFLLFVTMICFILLSIKRPNGSFNKNKNNKNSEKKSLKKRLLSDDDNYDEDEMMHDYVETLEDSKIKKELNAVNEGEDKKMMENANKNNNALLNNYKVLGLSSNANDMQPNDLRYLENVRKLWNNYNTFFFGIIQPRSYYYQHKILKDS